jgi:hypothetical protein
VSVKGCEEKNEGNRRITKAIIFTAQEAFTSGIRFDRAL